jgi:PAS domain S-box-containing protein
MSGIREMVSAGELFDEMKRYTRFGVEEERALRRLRDPARPHFSTIAREFYERSREHEAAHAVFKDEAQIGRLHASLVAWLERMLSGPWDDAYAEQSLRIGAVHDRIGLPQRYMFAGMALFRVRLQGIAIAELGADAAATVQALARVLDMELALMMESYAEAALVRVSRLEREREVVERATLVKGERRCAEVVALAGAVIIGLDAEGCVRIFNREAERVTGWAYDEIAGKSFVAELVVEDDKEFQTVWQKLQATGDSSSIAAGFAVRTRAGKLLDLSAQLTRARADAEPLFVLVARDVTDELALQARLRQSEKLAAVGTLAAGLAHEIRNPLNGAQLHLTFLERALKKRQPLPEVIEATQVVSSEIKRLSSLVTDFLYFARPVELSRQPTSIQAVCRRAFGMVRVDGRPVQLDIDLPDSEIAAEIDADRVQQVLLNVLQNAVDAVAAQGGRVVLRAYRKPRHAVIEVHDDGPGIPSPDAPIFDAFYSTKPGGTGLGLAIAHRIVTDHGGAIAVDSRPGSTTFRVTLPLRSPERASTAASLPPIVQEKKP